MKALFSTDTNSNIREKCWHISHKSHPYVMHFATVLVNVHSKKSLADFDIL